MAIPDIIFDLVIFGFMFGSPFIDRWLAGLHSYLQGAFTASLLALFAYLSMWEICRRSPLKRFRSQESLATALAASMVGLMFCLWRNDSPLVLLVLSIGIMMGALMAAISAVGCLLDWKLSFGEWLLVSLVCVGVVGGGAYLWLVAKDEHQAILIAEILIGALCLVLFLKKPERIVPIAGLLLTVFVAIAWGLLCSQVVLLGTYPAGSAVPRTNLQLMWLVCGVGFVGWTLFRKSVPSESIPPTADAPATIVPAIVWLGPIGLVLHRIFEARKLEEPGVVTGDAVETGEIRVPAEAPPSSIATQQQIPTISVILPGRLADRLALPVILATALNQFVL